MNWKQRTLVFILILSVSVAIHRSHLFSFPQAMHSWSQTDHLALSHGFIRNEFNFFLPETYMMNKGMVTYDNAITSVDFPINNYIVALIMKATGITHPVVFRVFTLLYCCTGLLFLFLLSFRIGSSYFVSGVVVVFTMSSAVYLDFQDGLIPASSALSNVFIGTYFLYRYWAGPRLIKDYIIALFFFSLAALIRTPFGLYLIALGGVSVFCAFIERKIPYKEWAFLLIAILFPAGYFLYNIHLRDLYGSLFLGNPIPPESWENAKQIFHNIRDRWLFHYFSVVHYAIFTLLIIFGYFFYNRKTVKTYADRKFLRWICLSVFGAFLFMFLMLKAYNEHDYYLLDSFFTPIILLFVFGITSFYRHMQSLWKKKAFLILFSLTTLAGFVLSIRTLHERRVYNPIGWVERLYDNYSMSSSILSDYNIKASDKILIGDALAPNLPFVFLQRKGYAISYPSKDLMPFFLKWDWDYMLLQDCKTEELYLRQDSTFLSSFKRVGGDGRLSIYSKRTLQNNVPQSMFDLFNISQKRPFFSDSSYTKWNDYRSTNEDSLIGWVRPEDEFSSSFSLSNFQRPDNTGVHVALEMDYKLTFPDNEILLVMTYEHEGSLRIYESVPIKNSLPDSAGFSKMQKLFALPCFNQKDKLGIGFWNLGKNEMFYKNLKLSLYNGAD